jgi:hypothetical protein
VGRVFTHLLQLRGVCLDVLHSRFLSWTKPLTSSLLLETLADLGRSKAELIAENALLRQQLIILSRQVKRPACSRSDRMLLVLLARLVRTWQQALFIVQPETLLRWHRDLFHLAWKRRSQPVSHTPKVAAETIALIREMAARNRRLRCRAYPRGITETRHSCVQADHPEVHETRSHTTTERTTLGDLSAPSRGRYLGLRLLAGNRSLLSTALRFLHHRIEVTEGNPRRRDKISDRSLGSATPPGSHPIWASTEVSDV